MPYLLSFLQDFAAVFLIIWTSTLFHELGHAFTLYIVNINNPKPFTPVKIAVWGAYGITNSILFHWIRRTPAKVRIVAISGFIFELILLIIIIIGSLLIKHYIIALSFILYTIHNYSDFKKSKDFKYFINPLSFKYTELPVNKNKCYKGIILCLSYSLIAAFIYSIPTKLSYILLVFLFTIYSALKRIKGYKSAE